MAILQGFAELLDHPAKELLKRPFVHYVANVPSKARDHFNGLREAKRDLVGIAIFVAIEQELNSPGALVEMKWRQREIENYLCYPDTLIAYAERTSDDPGPLFQSAQRQRQVEAMREAMEEIRAALQVLGKPDPFGPNAKASDDFLAPVFQRYFEKLELRNLMQKTDFHVLTRLVPRDLVAPEVSEKLDAIVEVARRANPVQ